jgi:transmembrane sensor
MDQGAHQDIQAEAIAWHIRLREGGAADWDAFVRWLEADPARSAAYDAVALADAALTAEAVPPRAANDDEEGGRWSVGRHWGTALAAAVALFLLGLIAAPWLTAGPDRYEVATPAGQHRTTPLTDGGSVQLNGATRLVLDRNDPRYAELVIGEATFNVRHDAAHPFVVVAGEHRVQDAGTTFNVIRDRGRFSVAVVEGSVVYDPGRAAVPLAPGQTLHADQGGRPVVGREDPQAIIGWQRGQLSYRAVPLEIVAADLSRSLGVEVAVDPALMALPFTGSIRVDRDAVTSLASTLGLQARRTGDSWLIEPHSRARR